MTKQILQRGQITVPKGIRQKYGLANGSEVDRVDLAGSILIVPNEAAVSVSRMNAHFDRVREDLAMHEQMAWTGSNFSRMAIHDLYARARAI